LGFFTKILLLTKNITLLQNNYKYNLFIPQTLLQPILNSKNQYIKLDSTGLPLSSLVVAVTTRAYNTYSQATYLSALNRLMVVSRGWEFREINEFFGSFFFLKNESRNLLLEYTFTGNPLKKEYPTSGYTEVFYHTSTRKITHTYLQNVEL